MSFAAVQKHVAVLERATLVTKERRGREQIVHANRETVGQASTLLDNYEQLWIQRAERIADILDQSQRRTDMTVITTTKDVESLTLSPSSPSSKASPDLVWEVWEDPRKLERWWGPPTFPATFTRHDFVVGGESRYFMTGPAGETPRRLVAHRRHRQAPPPRLSPTASPAMTANPLPTSSRCPAT
jgi:hypothetical protein